ncbi:hypothetical protein BDA96_10G268300 [Sorghum bicolor]|uniref:Uncharacterized protein n=1 Tax=Sorghum bicolor TaxID=4558 RepID=A0A921Q4D9_SORBI|nr:hypothetical protein BDA96_10G268300 [Sorghum bicolor]
MQLLTRCSPATAPHRSGAPTSSGQGVRRASREARAWPSIFTIFALSISYLSMVARSRLFYFRQAAPKPCS